MEAIDAIIVFFFCSKIALKKMLMRVIDVTPSRHYFKKKTQKSSESI